MAGKKATGAAEADSNKVAEDELAVKLSRDIDGGLGTHKEGTTLRHLSQSAFNTLVQGGLGDPVDAGTNVDGAVDAAAPLLLPGGDGAGSGE